MARSTHIQKGQRLNAAFKLLASGYAANHVASALAKKFHISLRQAYRYLQEAQQLQEPVSISDPIVPMTLKIPKNIAIKLRAHAHTNGITIGNTATRAITTFLAENEKQYGQPP